MSEPTQRRGRGGGRAARRAARENYVAPSRTCIERQIPVFDLLAVDGIEAIEAHADILLHEVGVEFRGDEEALRLFREAGAAVDGDRVRFEPGQIKALCASAPRAFTHHGRNPERANPIGGNRTVLAPAYGSPFVRDLENGRRYATLQDFENFVKLTYVSPYLHASGGTVCEPTDIPVNKRHMDMVYAHLRWSDKPCMGSVTAPERAADSIAMARIVFGDDFADDNCVIMGLVNVNSPLVYDQIMSGALRTYAAANQGYVVSPFILGGAMGPVTAAGTIAQAHAEAMTGIALGQLVRAGSPAIYGNFYTTMDLKSGAPTFGMPEAMLAYMAIGQLARRIGIPLRCGGHFTSSKVADGQALQESADSLLPALLAGSNWVLHAAGWLEGGLTMGYEKFVLDQERCGMMHRLMQGLSLDDNGFALDAFREAGPGQHYLGTAHTMANYETAFYESRLADATSFEQWRDAGEWDAERRALPVWQDMLASYQAPAIDPGIDEALRAFVDRKKAAVPDAWH